MYAKPVIFLAFANDRQNPGRYLPALQKERVAIEQVLHAYQAKDWGISHFLPSSDPKTLKHDLDLHSGQIIIFHFAGHGSGTQLNLEDTKGNTIEFSGSNLLAFLQEEPQLKLVFLNACASQEHVKRLFAIGIPAVIATPASISDVRAKDFSEAFYSALITGKSLKAAFEGARGVIDPQSPHKHIFRSLEFEERSAEQADFPWGLYHQDERILSWKLEPQIAHLLREGSQRFYDRLVTNPTGRFHHINIAEILLSTADLEVQRNRLMEVNISLNGQPLGKREAIEKLWEQDISHALVKGQGGMGKTVSLLQLWKLYLEKEGPIPIFIVLNEFNQIHTKNQVDWITHYILRHYLGEEPNTEAKSILWKWLKSDHENTHPKVLMLLDGFNELSVDSTPLQLSLQKDWREGCPGAQILLTSRYESNLTWTHDFHHFDLIPLTKDQIRAYLNQQGLSPILSNPLEAVLSNPMMLTIYVAANELVDKFAQHPQFSFSENGASKAEVLWNFLEAQLVKQGEMISFDQEKMSCLRWLKDHLLPWIGFNMEKQGKFDLDIWELEDMIGNYFQQLDALPLSQSTQSRQSPYHFYAKIFSASRQMWRFLEKDHVSQVDSWIQMLESDLKIINQNEAGNYAFRHQDFRDFYAAVHIQRSILVMLMLNHGVEPKSRVFPHPLKEAPLNIYLRTFLGELEQEYQNQPTFDETANKWRVDHFSTDNILEKLLDQCRGVFDETQLGYTVWNILSIWKQHRGELTATKLEDLDLQKFSFYDVRLSRPGLYTSLAKSALTEKNLFPQGHSDVVNHAKFSSDGAYVVTCSEDYSIKIWDAYSGQCLRNITGHKNRVIDLDLSDDMRMIASCSYDGTLKVWDFQSGLCIQTIRTNPGGDDVFSEVVFRFQHNQVVTSSWNKTIKIWDIQTGKSLSTLKGHTDFATCVDVSLDGKIIASGSKDETVKIWKAKRRRCLQTFQLNREASCVTLSPSGRFIAAASDYNAIVWDIKSKRALLTLGAQTTENRYIITRPIRSLCFSNDEKRLLAASRENAKIWDIETGNCLLVLQGHESQINTVTFSVDNKRILTSSTDKSAKIWDAQTGQCLLTLPGQSNTIMCQSFGSKNRLMLTGSNDKDAKLWDLETGTCLSVMQRHPNGIGGITFSQDDKRFLTGSWDRGKASWLWETFSGRCLLKLEEHKDSVAALAFSNTGKYLATGSWDNTAKLWNAHTGECIRTFEIPIPTWLSHGLNHINDVKFSQDDQYLFGWYSFSFIIWQINTGTPILNIESKGTSKMLLKKNDKEFVIVGSGHKFLEIIDLQTKNVIRRLKSHEDKITCWEYHEQSDLFATGSEDQKVKLWEFGSAKCLFTLTGHTKPVNALAFREDAKILASGSKDHKIRLWNTQTGVCLHTLESHPSLVTRLFFNSMGDRLVSYCYGRCLKIWDTSSGTCLHTHKEFSSRFTHLIAENGREYLVSREYHSMNVWDFDSGELVQSLPNVPGLLFQGCNFTDLHPDSQLSEETRKIIRHYGGIFSPTDADRWKTLEALYFDNPLAKP